MKNKGNLLVTILCVITLLWSSFSIVNQVYWYRNIESLKIAGNERFKIQMKKATSPIAKVKLEYLQHKFYQKYLHKTDVISIGIIGDILCILGAIILWYGIIYGLPFYILGQLLPFAYSLYLTGFQSDIQLMISEFYGLIIPVIMIILFIVQAGKESIEEKSKA